MGLLGRLLGKESGRSKQIRRVLDERGIVEGARVEVVVPNILKNYV